MIIFGTRGVTSRLNSGRFYCPGCCTEQRYEHKQVRRFFSLYFIPVIPLDRLAEYIECQSCQGTYQLAVLQHTPQANQAAIESAFHGALRQVMVEMVEAAQTDKRREIEVFGTVLGRVTQTELTTEVTQREFERAQADRPDLGTRLAQLAPYLSDEGKEMIVRAALQVASASGGYSDAESAVIGTITKSLGISVAHLKGLMETINSHDPDAK